MAFSHTLSGTRYVFDDLTTLLAQATPEMVAAVSKIMRRQDLIAVAAKCRQARQARLTGVGLKDEQPGIHAPVALLD